VHFATFRLSREPVEEPLARLYRAAGSDAHRIVGGRVGATWELPER
jgi:hypothetical protein